MIAAVLGLLAAVGTLFWSIKYNSDKHDSKSIKQETVKQSIRIRTIDPSLVPQANDNNDEGRLKLDDPQNYLGNESVQPPPKAQDNEAPCSIPKWQSEMFFE